MIDSADQHIVNVPGLILGKVHAVSPSPHCRVQAFVYNGPANIRGFTWGPRERWVDRCESEIDRRGKFDLDCRGIESGIVAFVGFGHLLPEVRSDEQEVRTG